MADERRPLLERHSTLTLVPWDPSRARKSGVLILISVVLERLAFYSVIMNLFLYLNRGQPETRSWDPVSALTAIYIVNGVACLSAPLSGCLSDSLVGRYWAVVLGMVLYILGYILLTVLASNGLALIGCNWKTADQALNWDIISHPCYVQVTIMLVLIGAGVGCVRANIPPFLAEQVRAGSRDAICQFFNAYYWCANLGAAVGVGVLSYVEQNFEDGFYTAFLTATLCLCASLAVFCAGRCYYVIHQPRIFVLSNIVGILCEGVFNSCSSGQGDNLPHSPARRRDLRQPANAAIPVASSPLSFIDRAKISYGGSFHDTTVDDVKRLGVTLSLILLLLPYWIVYLQMSTSFQAQGLHMLIYWNVTASTEFVIPSAWLTLCDELFILLLIPLLGFVVYPLLDRSRRRRTSPLRRIMVGMMLSLTAAVCAGLVELRRLEAWRSGGSVEQVVSGTSYNASSMAIVWQIPQYCLVGAAEALAGVAGLELVYTTAPRSFQGIVMGLFAAVEGLAAFLCIGLVQGLHLLGCRWIREEESDFNDGHLDYFFYLLAGLQLFAMLLLAFVLYAGWKLPSPDSSPRGSGNLEASLGASVLHSELYPSDGHLSEEPSHDQPVRSS